VNTHLGPARNKALEQATAKYIAFLDSDDVYLPCALQRQVELMESDDSRGHITLALSRLGKASSSLLLFIFFLDIFHILSSLYVMCIQMRKVFF
jgi:glycosyltransferase involved in cell wall biosynthesis